MKANVLKSLLILAVAAVLAVSCKDRDSEKRIAELEARLAELEGKKTVPNNVADGIATPTATDPSATNTAAKEAKPEGPLPVAVFAKTEHDFGTIREGETVEYTYAVRNTGEVPLIIQNAQPSCGCTVPDWTKSPIAPGGTGYVKAKFDSNNKPGIQNKTITVTANTWPKQTVLRFKAMVTPKPTGEDGPVK